MPLVVLAAASSNSFKIEPPPPNSASPSFIASLKPASSTFWIVPPTIPRPCAHRHTRPATCTRELGHLLPHLGHALRPGSASGMIVLGGRAADGSGAWPTAGVVVA